jgi:hypothetical protein
MRNHSDEEIWELICKAAAEHSGIPTEHARAILEDVGYSASQHHGVGDAVEFVRHGFPDPEAAPFRSFRVARWLSAIPTAGEKKVTITKP